MMPAVVAGSVEGWLPSDVMVVVAPVPATVAVVPAAPVAVVPAAVAVVPCGSSGGGKSSGSYSYTCVERS